MELDSQSSRIEEENARLKMHIRSIKNEIERTNELTKKLDIDLNEQVRELDRQDAIIDGIEFDRKNGGYKSSEFQSAIAERKAR